MLLAAAACIVLTAAPAFHDGTRARAAIERLHDPIAWVTLAVLALRGMIWLRQQRGHSMPRRLVPLIYPAVNFLVLAGLSLRDVATQNPALAGACWLSISVQAMVPPRTRGAAPIEERPNELQMNSHHNPEDHL